MKAFQAHAKGCTATAETPRKAAQKFFQTFPNKRKCNITEGTVDGPFFTVIFDGRIFPQRWKDVTKKQIDTLPDASAG